MAGFCLRRCLLFSIPVNLRSIPGTRFLTMATSFIVKALALALALSSSASALPPHGHSPWQPPSTTCDEWQPSATWDPWHFPTGRPTFQASPVVLLPSGPVIGTTTSLPSATVTVNKFLGVPFAQSPPERFSPPQDPAAWGWRAPLNATEFKPACIQQFVCEYKRRQQRSYSGLGTLPGSTSALRILEVIYIANQPGLDPLASQQFTEYVFNNPPPPESEGMCSFSYISSQRHHHADLEKIVST